MAAFFISDRISVNTEITDSNAIRGWIFYDAACPPCVTARQRTGRLFASRGFSWLPLQSPGSAARLQVPESDFAIRLHLQLPDGRVLNNADAFAVLCRSVWWLWPLGMLLRIPGFRELGRATYDWIARNRYSVLGACPVNRNEHGAVTFADWLIAALVPTVAVFVSRAQPAWVQMWAITLALGIAFKWLAWRDALAHGLCPSPVRALLWFTVWPGMDGRAFLDETKRPNPPAFAEWLWATGAILLGASLIWWVTPSLVVSHTMAAAWVGMVGIVLMAHFGIIRVLSLLCRSQGINAFPIMNSPAAAASLADFWGARWNTGFSIPARRLLLQPLARRHGAGVAVLVVFLVSGLIHELVISLPAHGGYGLPTLYFLLQWAGLVCERSRGGRGSGLGAGLIGWLFTACLTIAPLYWLFHPAFANRVVLPFLDFLNHP